MSYGDFEKELVIGHKYEIESGIVLKGNPDLANGKAKQKYTKFISDVQSVKAKEYLVTDFDKIGKKDVIELAMSIIVFMLGEKVLPDVTEFFKRLMPARNNNMACLDGVTVTIVNKNNGEKTEFTQIPDIETSSSVVAIVHEFIHYYLNKNNIDMTKKRYYQEVLSILAEKIAHHIIELTTHEMNFSQKIEESRLEALSYHYSTQLPALESRIREHEHLKKTAKKGDVLSNMILLKMEREIPLIDTPQNREILKDYYYSQAESYGIGYLYADYLFKKFIDDPKALKKQITNLQNHEKSFQEILDYYDMNLKNYQLYNSVNETLQMVKQQKL